MKQEIIQQLFRQHYDKMQRVARSLLYDEQESEDVVSDIFESLLQGKIALIPGAEERYLLTSVRNRCLKRLRHEAIARATAEKHESAALDDSAADDERLTDIVEFVVGHLSPQEQRIFNLRFTDGCSYEDIATAEGISRVAVWKHLSHIITEIKRQFNPTSL
ncbi:MAG: sigma-70 family RNA polymerase sigma factor [Bacteroidaceae bacterium]|nr:sigma-70 family RNA polymerase sigma factor [Bacteroidaceae bacterium]